jgi:hypothetical protein
MNAIVLTEEQAVALGVANEGSMLTLEPRRLSDGRLILNADVLDDPCFTDRSRGWAAVFLAPVEAVEQSEEPREVSPEIDVDLEVEQAAGAVQLAPGVQRVVLSEEDMV